MVVLLKKKETHIGSDGCFFQGNGKTILRTNSQIIKISRGIVKWSQTINTPLSYHQVFQPTVMVPLQDACLMHD